jgi:hypothetical protein
VEAGDVARVLPLDDRPEEVAHDGLDDPRRATGDALPDAGDAVVGRDLDEGGGKGVVGAGAEVDGLSGLGGERPGREFVYFQGRFPPQGATG